MADADSIEVTHEYEPAYVNYVLFLIFLVAVFNVCDRTIISVLVDDIKVDMALSDRQMGLVMGFAFSITYFLAGIPLARLADKGSRTLIVSSSLLVWSLMTALTGTAQNFFQLVVTRMGVGIGEAGGSPPCQSLLSEYVPKSRRARAMAILTIGALVGSGFGVAFGGWAGTQFGWRWALALVGIPGAALGVLFYLTVKEPPRPVGHSEIAAQDDSLLQTLHRLIQIPAYVHMTVAACFIALVGVGRQFWEPTFMRRLYDMSAQEVGLTYMLISIVPAVIGAYGLSIVMDKLAVRDKRWYAWMPAMCIFITVPMSLAFYASDPGATLLGIPLGFYFSVMSSLFVSIWAPATMTLAQNIVPANVRAVSAASWSLISSLVGAGLGPLIVGDLNTRMESVYGEEAIRYSLSIITLASIVASFFYLVVARKLPRGTTRDSAE